MNATILFCKTAAIRADKRKSAPASPMRDLNLWSLGRKGKNIKSYKLYNISNI